MALPTGIFRKRLSPRRARPTPSMSSGLLRRFFESLVGVPQVFRQIPGGGLGAWRVGRTIWQSHLLFLAMRKIAYEKSCP